MAANVLNVYGEIIGIGIGAIILWIFAITFAPFYRRRSMLPGASRSQKSRDHHGEHEEEAKGKRAESAGEVVRADGFIDSFAGVIQEAGGGLPLIVKISIIAIPLWWLLYIIINFSQYLLSIRSFQ
jgi:hypothetical protein